MEKNNLQRMEALDLSNYNRPYECVECGGHMVFKGVGEYECEKCKALAYDDYGKVRTYIEANPGANLAKIAEQTKVGQRSIIQMLKESRLEVAQGSCSFMKCTVCGADIRSGILCHNCEVAYNRGLEEKLKKARKFKE